MHHLDGTTAERDRVVAAVELWLDSIVNRSDGNSEHEECYE